MTDVALGYDQLEFFGSKLDAALFANLAQRGFDQGLAFVNVSAGESPKPVVAALAGQNFGASNDPDADDLGAVFG